MSIAHKVKIVFLYIQCNIVYYLTSSAVFIQGSNKRLLRNSFKTLNMCFDNSTVDIHAGIRK
jgi:hypothetical protein